ncbi:MAG TPA: N-acetylmuramoyl-L-alanine amidase [Mobilitalea sp.]|nr:N-acetylmuramoyl-L-alanine amidase [Mobilitalea sp.]
MKKNYLSVVLLALVCLAMLLSSDKSIKVMKNIFNQSTINADSNQIVIVIDPGHGGRDPGKVGVNNLLEKDINLSVAFKLKKLLEQNDIKVIMTREEDILLASDTDSNKKRADMNNRVHIIRDNKADLAISIHQNSYPEEYVKGSQVFYHAKSDQGKRLADMIQEQIREAVKDDNHRQAKSNDSYFLLKYTECPLVIVECGFLTNNSEAMLLKDDTYQEKMAWGIHLGIMQYINEVGKDTFLRN